LRPGFSEYTYANALTQELFLRGGLGISTIPIFPTQHEEGSENGGYDVILETPGLPIFLQFKVSEVMRKANAKEVGNYPLTTRSTYVILGTES
jgi:hypothetical protein